MELYKPLKDLYHSARKNIDDIFAVTVIAGVAVVALWDLGVFSYRNREPVKMDIPVPQIERPVEIKYPLPKPRTILRDEAEEIKGTDITEFFEDDSGTEILSDGMEIGIRKELPYEAYPGWEDDLKKLKPDITKDELERIIKETQKK